MALWLAQWEMPFLFAVDANAPRDDVADWSGVRFFMPSAGPGRPGEEMLLGPPGTRLHRGQDLWRVWLASTGGTADRQAVPLGGPLAQSHFTGGRWHRYDHLYATPEILPVRMQYETPDANPERAVSDHALVTATLEVHATSS
jgi:hypothetical protein